MYCSELHRVINTHFTEEEPEARVPVSPSPHSLVPSEDWNLFLWQAQHESTP